MGDSRVRHVVTTVHGTYAKTATWVKPNSKLGEALTSRFGESVTQVVPFRWSGCNSSAARTKAKDGLREHLRQLLEQYPPPQAKHYIIAHSHEGNVAFYALRDKSIQKEVSGVACLATPFLVPLRREWGSEDMTGHLVGAGTFLFFTVSFLADWWFSIFESAWRIVMTELLQNA